MNRNIGIAFILFTIAQGLIWYQTNSQFFNSWVKERPLLMATMGVPISYILIYASRYVVEGFDGLLWPGRLIGFSTGMVIMAILTYIHLDEGITSKMLYLKASYPSGMVELYEILANSKVYKSTTDRWQSRLLWARYSFHNHSIYIKYWWHWFVLIPGWCIYIIDRIRLTKNNN